MPTLLNHDHTQIDALLELMKHLRDPTNGCPWDIAQDFASVAPHTIEEAYEVADAIERSAFEELKSELGDLLFQVVFHSQIASERKLFAFKDVVCSVTDKMLARHPHVFGDDNGFDKENHNEIWEARKSQERKLQGQTSLMDDVPNALPAASRATKIQKRAATVGFDWDDVNDVTAKVTEEWTELLDAMETGNSREIEGELGDLMFAVINLARHQKIDPEAALRRTNQKFMRRFRYIENALSTDDSDIADASLERMEELWQNAKTAERE